MKDGDSPGPGGHPVIVELLSNLVDDENIVASPPVSREPRSDVSHVNVILEKLL